MKRETPALATLTVGGLFLIGVFTGAATGAAALARANDPYAGLELFASVLTIIESDYMQEIPQDVLIDAAIRGMTEELDPHTRWLSAEQTRALRDETAGKAHGLGLRVELDDAGLAVVREVLPGSSAGRDGINPGDKILAIDGTLVTSIDPTQVTHYLEGVRGTSTVLRVQGPNGQERTIETVHDAVDHDYAYAQALNEHIVYARVEQFPHGVSADLLGAVQAASRTTTTGLILDLRDNPGGVLEEAVAVCDLFFSEGVLVSTKNRVEGTAIYRAAPGGLPDDLDVVVLVNRMSASASEIVAGALQDRDRATLIGTPTYGKGSVQSVYRNPDDSALKLTVGAYFTPSGAPVAPQQGRAPDLVVPLTPLVGPKQTLIRALDAIELEHDEKGTLLELVQHLPDDPASTSEIRWDLPLDKRIADDAQLQAAIAKLADQL